MSKYAAQREALLHLAEQINAPDDVPAACLRDSAYLIEYLENQVDVYRAALEQIMEYSKDTSRRSYKTAKQALEYAYE